KTSKCHRNPRNPSIDRTRREGRDARGLHSAIEALVPGGEALVVAAIARAVDIEERDDQPRTLVVTTHAAGSLDVLRCGLGLSQHRHETETGDVETDRDHVRR